ncbi:putative Wd40 repeat-like protein [Phytophthora infestans]|uniref:Putative Wd40 repeat-like protein n=1 Tax=Phytophthora infestans TaxID=4787 RepID=A0A833W4Y5_PHYIN|nr:putative Wd40 repeat-like protein [Phytophthora infestans]
MTDELELLTPPPQAAPSSGRVGLSAATLVYSSDGRYVFQRQAHVVRVLHSQSGRVLHECVRADNKSAVRALALHPHNALQLLAAYEDGYIIVWDFVEHKPLAELDAKAPVLWMGSSRTSASQLLLVVQTDANTWSLIEFSLKKKKRGPVCCHAIEILALPVY